MVNNSLAYCTFEPKGNPRDAHPGRRKLSGDVPAIVMRDDRPWLVVGTPGGHTIAQTVPQVIMNVIDFDMNIQEALDAGRISFIEPDWIAVKGSIPEAVRHELSARGHKVRVVGGLGNAHALCVEYDARGRLTGFSGAADRRGLGWRGATDSRVFWALLPVGIDLRQDGSGGRPLP